MTPQFLDKHIGKASSIFGLMAPAFSKNWSPSKPAGRLRCQTAPPCVGPTRNGHMVSGIWYLVYGIWDMGYALRCMVYGIWHIVYGIWYMVYGMWFMVYGIWYMVYRTWYGVDGPHGGLHRRGRHAHPTHDHRQREEARADDQEHVRAASRGHLEVDKAPQS